MSGDIDPDDDDLEPGVAPGVSAFEKVLHLCDIGQHDLAARTAADALALAPNAPELHFAMAVARSGQKRPDDAEASARRALELDPEFMPAHAFLGRVLTKAGRHVDAERVLLEGLRLAPDDVDLYLAYAQLTFKVGQLDKAERLVARVLARDPECVAAHGLMSILQSERGKTGAARLHGGRALNLAPDEDGSHVAAGAAFLRSGRPFRARRHLREALRLDPGDAHVESLYLEADKACRWIYLPMYWWSLAIDRLPGKQYLVWGVLVAGVSALRAAGVDKGIVTGLACGYVAVCLYTWVADPLVRLWLKIVPPR